MTRRRALMSLGGWGTALAAAPLARAAGSKTMPTDLITRPIPHSASGSERLPAIGLGTWQTFDVGGGDDARKPLRAVLDGFLTGGGRVIDSSPMYGQAEEVVGDLLAERPRGPSPFLATKVWTSGRARGEDQMKTSMRRMRASRLDLLQVHNLVDWRTQLATLQAWKDAGRVRYIGVTHYQLGAFAELESIVAREKIDFVQLPFSIATREAEDRLLPAAAQHGVAVLVMRPFEEGALFRSVKGRSPPAFCADFDCASWAQFFLKFILSHPAVTCPIPATANPAHLADNLAGGRGRLPDAATRRRMIAAFDEHR